MSGFLDDDREPLPTPTLSAFMRRLGAPQLTFSLTDTQVDVPLGVATCCRVVHQSHCAHHVAASLVKTFAVISRPDHSVSFRRPREQGWDGDILAHPVRLAEAVQTIGLQLAATAEACGGQVTRMTFRVWSLNLELAEMWRCRSADDQGQELLVPPDLARTRTIEALPIVLIAPDDAASTAIASAFRPVASYAHRVLVLPHEIGHDTEARYVTDLVWGEPDAVYPAALALRADPTEERDARPPDATRPAAVPQISPTPPIAARAGRPDRSRRAGAGPAVRPLRPGQTVPDRRAGRAGPEGGDRRAAR